MLTRTQRDAVQVFKQVSEVAKKDKEYRDKYSSMAHKLPVLIRTAGLPQAVAFVVAKAEKEKAWGELINHLAQAVGYADGTALAEASRSEPSLSKHMHLTSKTLDALLWYKRFAQSLLDF